jgi:hypothetical protein
MDSEDEFDRMIPITTAHEPQPCARLDGILTSSGPVRQAAASRRYHSNPPAGGSAGGPAVQELKKAKRKEKMKAKKENTHRLQSLEAASSSL